MTTTQPTAPAETAPAEITWTRVDQKVWVARSRRRRFAGMVEISNDLHARASDAHGYSLGDHLRITAARHAVERQYGHPNRGALLSPLGITALVSGSLAIAIAALGFVTFTAF